MTGIATVHQGIDSFVSWASDRRPRIGLGLPFFDEATKGGLAKAECLMVMATSSGGKTWVALNAIANNPDIATLFCSLEMSWRQVVARLTAITTGVPTWELESELKHGRKPGQFFETISKFPLLLGNDSSEQSIKDINATVKHGTEMLGTPIRLVVIDYLELIGGSGMLGKSEQVDRAAQKIRTVAKDNDCSVIVLHQVGKSDGGGGFEPLSLESGRYGGHAPMDSVLAAYSPRLNRDLSRDERARIDSDLYLQLLKNRNGMASPEGVRHRLDKFTGKISPYGAVVAGPSHQSDMFAPPEYPDSVDNFERVFG